MITRLSHSTIYVLDQDRALDFYTRILGFELRTDFTMEGGFRWLTVGPKEQPDSELVLYAVAPGGLLDDDAVGHLRAILERGLMGPGVLETDDCRGDYERMRAAGVEFLSAPQEQMYGIEATFRDGCGNWFSLTQHR